MRAEKVLEQSDSGRPRNNKMYRLVFVAFLPSILPSFFRCSMAVAAAAAPGLPACSMLVMYRLKEEEEEG